eukprot:TRINITY_DN2143_c0_g1_i1.p1 TRINITY_DN2143_c0_g1~~TRINITY_DN2143_c0_g1_i1.p1  ORF type:complete len:245 (-),score=60.98 TRINITY_DN2143_c0_g1_i1:415-1149(-)
MRRAGIAGLMSQSTVMNRYQDVGKKIEENQMEHMKKQLTSFQDALLKFASKHKTQINANPLFRSQFQQMCEKIGVDPLASYKGFWSQILGVGDFYYELAVQMVDVCLMTRAQNGGLISMEELVSRLKAKRGKLSQAISADDVQCSVKKMSCLGEGFRILNVGSRVMVASVPCELNKDHMVLLELAQTNEGLVSVSLIQKKYNWDQHRIDTVVNLLLQEGMLWIDNQGKDTQYGFPSIFSSSVRT